MREEIENPMVRDIEDSPVLMEKCVECNSRLYSDEEVVRSPEGFFCDYMCFLKHHDAEYIDGWDE